MKKIIWKYPFVLFIGSRITSLTIFDKNGFYWLWMIVDMFAQLFDNFFFPPPNWPGQARLKCAKMAYFGQFLRYSQNFFFSQKLYWVINFFPKINFFPIIALARAKWVWLAEMTSYLVISRWNFKIFFSPEIYVELNKFFKKIFFPVNLLTKADWAEIGGSHIFD